MLGIRLLRVLLGISSSHLAEVVVGKVVGKGEIGGRHLLWSPVLLEDIRHLINLNNREHDLDKGRFTMGMLAPTVSEQH